MRPSLDRPLPALLLAACLALGGCYTLQAVQGQLEVLGARRSLAEVRADPATDARTALALTIAAEARDLTHSALGTASGSYRSFVRLPREWPVWNLVIAPEFEVAPRPQCFVLIGCLAYRGFFDETDARVAFERARARGDDAFLAPVPAYSTLGWFDDPIMWSMLRWDEATLAGMIAHELAHEALYTGDDTAFDEAFAETVGNAVVRRMFAGPERAAALARWESQRRNSAARETLLLAARADLAVLYAQPLDDAAKRAGKQARLTLLVVELGALDAGSVEAPRAESNWDNARLALTATYSELVPGFEALLAEEGGDLAHLKVRAAALAREPIVERRRVLRAKAGAGAAAAAQSSARSSAARPE